ncbi:MAG: hypothetical protein NTX24_04440 [Candidatus Pacearchaeota archaeon]|nr:hypothetical protein [Candidatus Pacearchaeota archaeon]
MALAIDLTGLGTFMPIFAFLLVFTITYALLAKTKVLGEQKFVHIFVSFCISIVFVISANAIEYVKVITPFFAAFIVSLLFILLIIGLIKGDIGEFFKTKGFTWFVVIILIIIFVFAALFVFAPIINQYMAGPKQFLLQPQILGVIILVGLTAFTAWLLTRGSK